jgi:hypothetical protein
VEPRRQIDLGVDLASTRPRGVFGCWRCSGYGQDGMCRICQGSGLTIDWVLVRGGDEPLHPAWVRGIRDQCAAAGVPFAFLGWGYWKPIYEPTDEPAELVVLNMGVDHSGRLLDGRDHFDSPWGKLEVAP